MLDLQSLSNVNQKLVKDLVNLIEECSNSLSVGPLQVEYNDLLKWAKKNNKTKLFDNQKAYKKIGGFTAIKNACFTKTESSDDNIDKKIIKDKVKTLNKALKKDTDSGHFLRSFDTLASKIFANKIVPSEYSRKTIKKDNIKRELHLVLSDMHFQSLLDPQKCGSKYSCIEEARRLAYIILETSEYKLQYRNETVLKLHILGDIIKGIIHDTENGPCLTTQISAAISLLSQAISYLSSKFPFVEIYCATGNHGRNPLRHRERAVQDKWDSFETTIYIALKYACSGLKNVKLNIPLTPYYSFESFGAKGFATHGDTVFTTGNVSGSINVTSLENKVGLINAGCDKDKYKLFLVGHMHTGTIVNLHSGTKIIVNGTLMPPDEYAQSIGVFNTVCGQWLFESVPGHFVGDCRFIEVDSSIDNDKSLDQIIKPFTDLT